MLTLEDEPEFSLISDSSSNGLRSINKQLSMNLMTNKKLLLIENTFKVVECNPYFMYLIILAW